MWPGERVNVMTPMLSQVPLSKPLPVPAISDRRYGASAQKNNRREMTPCPMSHPRHSTKLSPGPR